jgi:putative ABC transport system permease protein
MALRNLGRRPARSALTALGIALAVASLISLVGLARGLERAWSGSLSERGTHVVAVRRGAVEILTTSVDEAHAQGLARLPGISDVAGELVDLVTLETGQTLLVTGWSPDSYLWRTLRLTAGVLPGAGSEPGGAVVGEAGAEALGIRVGARLRLHGGEFVVTGIARPTGTMSNHMLFVPLPALQARLSKPGRVTMFNLRLRHPDDPDAVRRLREAVSVAFPELVLTEVQHLADQNDILRLLRAMAWAISTVALVMGLVFVVNTLLMSVTERTREIGVLSAVGWSSGRIVALIALEGLCLAGAGATLGVGLGWVGLQTVSALPHMRGFLQPELSGRLVAEVAVAALLLGVVGSAYPAWRASGLSPADALRHE